MVDADLQYKKPAKRPTIMDDLPIDVIHNIMMRYLPYKDAAKLMFLSKSFKSYWLSFPALSFSFESTKSERDNEQNYQEFFSKVKETLKVRGPHINSALHSLSLFHYGIGENNSNAYQQLLDMLLYFALEKKVEVIELQNLELIIHGFGCVEIVDVHCDSFLPLFSSQYLTILKLTGINFSHVADIFINCPKLEELSIKDCDGFSAIKVSASSSSLKKVEVTCCTNLNGIQIEDGTSLQSFVFEEFYESEQDTLYQYTVDILISCPKQLRVLKLIKATTITDEWLNSIIQCSSYLEELEISECNLLRKIEFESQSLKKFSLLNCMNMEEVIATVPNLHEFNYDACASVDKMLILGCPTQIRVLKLFKATVITDEWLNWIIQCSSYLEELEISECSLLSKMEFESQSLKKFSLLNCMNMKEVIASVPNLHEFNYGACELVHKVLILACPTQIRVLKLFKATTITDEWLNWIICGSSYLEELEISECNFLRNMEFENKSLKKFSLLDCLNLKEVIADVPNLYEFDYNGSLLVSRLSIVASGCNGNISLPSMIPYHVLKDFFRFFSHFKQLTLSFTSYESLTIPMHNCPQSPAIYGNGMLDIKLKVNLYDPVPSGRTLTQVLETLLWLISKPRSITFSSTNTEKRSTLKFEYGEERKSKIVKVGECCKDNPLKCWRHYEREIIFEGFYGNKRERLEKFFNVN